MLTPYEIIFLNSLKASIITAMYDENAWYAALLFGTYKVWGITVAAILGSGIGNCLNFGAGYFIARKRQEWFSIKEEIYQFISRLSNFFMLFLALPFSSMPVIGVFWSLFVLCTGFFSAKPLRGIALIIIGRFIYYGYYVYSDAAISGTDLFRF